MSSAVVNIAKTCRISTSRVGAEARKKTRENFLYTVYCATHDEPSPEVDFHATSRTRALLHNTFHAPDQPSLPRPSDNLCRKYYPRFKSVPNVCGRINDVKIINPENQNCAESSPRAGSEQFGAAAFGKDKLNNRPVSSQSVAASLPSSFW